MLLIDAVYINNSGGLELLFTLISRLESLDIDVHYLLDSRCKKILYGKIVRGRYSFSDPSMLQRLFFYLHHRRIERHLNVQQELFRYRQLRYLSTHYYHF